MKIVLVTDGEFVGLDFSPRPRELVEDLQRGNARELRLVGTFDAPAPEDTRRAYRQLRFRLSDRVVRGSWYAATDLEALRELEAVDIPLRRA